MTDAPKLTREQIERRMGLLEEAIEYGAEDEKDQRMLIDTLHKMRDLALASLDGDTVRVPREPTGAMLDAAKALPAIRQINEWCAEMQIVRGRKPCFDSSDPPLAQAYRAMLAAAQEGVLRAEWAERRAGFIADKRRKRK